MPEAYQTNAAGQNADHHASKYRFEEAIGDLVDNSIDAQATKIDVFFGDQDLVSAGSPQIQGKNEFTYPNGLGYLHEQNSAFLIVADNGTGMSATEFTNAVIKGQRRKYAEYELGHFGVGLKKSTMSQCYETTIFTKKEGKLSIKRISSVHIQESGKDELLNVSDFKGSRAWMANTKAYKTCLDLVNGYSSGTIVLMEGLHKLEKSIGSDTVADRKNFINKIKEKIRAYLGVIFERYIEGGHKIPLTNGKIHIIPKIDIKFSGKSVKPIDPFFKKFADPGHNRWTLSKKLTGVNTFIQPPGKPETKVALDSTIYIIPRQSDLSKKTGAVFNDETLLKSRDGLTRISCQGIYIYRNQRLIDFGHEDAWKGIMSTHNTNALGRWEVHLPPHLPPNLRDLDFTLDSTKTDSRIGKKTLDEMNRPLSKKFKWHPRDSMNLTLRDRMTSYRPANKTGTSTKRMFETNCKDCGAVGHYSKMSPICPKYVAPAPPPVITPTPITPSPTLPATSAPPSTTPSAILSTPNGTHNVKVVKTGDLVEVSGNDVTINQDHPGFSDLDYWFKTN